MKTFPVLALISALSLPLSAQQIRVGSLEGNLAVFSNSPITIVDWTRPALTTGTVNTADVAWRDATTPCDGIFYVRFYVIPSNSFSTVMTAERGPFRAENGINTVTLSPAVNVTSETYIGIRRNAGPDSCGRPYGTFTRNPGRALIATEDVTSGSITAFTPSTNFRLQAQATNIPSVRVSTIPVVGSTPGAFGSFFRTSLTLTNPSTYPIRGKLVFRQAGRAGSDSDPTLDYLIPRLATLNYADVVATMGQTGQGSLDILTTSSPTPIANARVFNDAGTAGTNGLSVDAVPAEPNFFSVANVLIPEDLTNFRLAVGVRTFSPGDLNVSVVDANGQLVKTLVKSYPADFFAQVGGEAFTEGPLPPGGKIVVSAFTKEFIVYGAVTDNRTNDPSIRVGAD